MQINKKEFGYKTIGAVLITLLGVMTLIAIALFVVEYNTNIKLTKTEQMYKELQIKYEEQKKNMNELQISYDNLKNDYMNIKSNYDLVKSDLNLLQSRYDKKQEENQQLQENYDELQVKLDELNDIDSLDNNTYYYNEDTSFVDGSYNDVEEDKSFFGRIIDSIKFW